MENKTSLSSCVYSECMDLAKYDKIWKNDVCRWDTYIAWFLNILNMIEFKFQVLNLKRLKSVFEILRKEIKKMKDERFKKYKLYN